MKLVICTDSKNGIMFNGRRQSQDSAVCEDILATLGEALLYTDSYSFRLFDRYGDDRVICSDNPAVAAGSDDFCFAEDMNMTEAVTAADMLIIYCWNRNYPADRYFDVDTDIFSLALQTEFEGSSHEKITKRVYTR